MNDVAVAAKSERSGVAGYERAPQLTELGAGGQHPGSEIEPRLISGISKRHPELDFLGSEECTRLSEIRTRSYLHLQATMSCLLAERHRYLGRQHGEKRPAVALMLKQISLDELNHQRLFRGVGSLLDGSMKPGYRFTLATNALAKMMQSNASWASLAISIHMAMLANARSRRSEGYGKQNRPLVDELYERHWREKSRVVVVDRLEWERANATLDPQQRGLAFEQLIGLIEFLDEFIEQQASADADYFVNTNHRPIGRSRLERLRTILCRAYHQEFLLDGVSENAFKRILRNLATPSEYQRLFSAARCIPQIRVLH